MKKCAAWKNASTAFWACFSPDHSRPTPRIQEFHEIPLAPMLGENAFQRIGELQPQRLRTSALVGFLPGGIDIVSHSRIRTRSPLSAEQHQFRRFGHLRFVLTD